MAEGDLHLEPGPGIPLGLVIPGAELDELEKMIAKARDGRMQ